MRWSLNLNLIVVLLVFHSSHSRFDKGVLVDQDTLCIRIKAPPEPLPLQQQP